MNSQRHDLIFLNPGANFFVVSMHENKKQIENEVSAWFSRGLPCVYAKQISGEETINLGLPLWYAHKKHRVGLRVRCSEIHTQKPPPQLIELQDFFLHSYGIGDLHKIVEAHEMNDIAVYGSFLSQYLSGHDFVTNNSDIDLLIKYHGYTLAHLRAFINALTEKFNRIIDGEVRFQELGDISLKELFTPSTKKILCKCKDQVILLSRTELYERYPLL